MPVDAIHRRRLPPPPAAAACSALTSGMSLALSPCKPAPASKRRKGGEEGEAAVGTIEQIEKVRQPGQGDRRTLNRGASVAANQRCQRGGCAARSPHACLHTPPSLPRLTPLHPQIVHVRQPGSLELRPRSVRQLSGGERRRVALALALGFSELAAQRGRLRR